MSALKVMQHPKMDPIDHAIDDRHIHLTGPDRNEAGITERLGPQGAQVDHGGHSEGLTREHGQKCGCRT